VADWHVKRALTMSADNGIYILITSDKIKQESIHHYRNLKGEVVTAYRVAHGQAIDSFEWYEIEEPYNLGWWMSLIWNNSKVFYSEKEAMLEALRLQEETIYTEYGIQFVDARKYNFPGS